MARRTPRDLDPLGTSPELTSAVVNNEALVTTSTGLTLRFPMYCLPLSHTHLHHVLHHYSTHPTTATSSPPPRPPTHRHPHPATPDQTEETPTNHQQDPDSPAPTP
ncbi:hypothetical protein [Actinomyces lilanjuaniae]|uniref:hypothetical protein n=1 Tax=Actinomyces lilanjuaniae TaxID=2321394 RepID=UPI0013C4C5F5|nr:hypothetical protein [Actinomyces lilanjuaniae]